MSEKLGYTMEEAAAQLGAGRSTMFKLVAAGNIESVKIGRQRIIPADALREFLEKQRALQSKAAA